jgi:hypothetical protein
MAYENKIYNRNFHLQNPSNMHYLILPSTMPKILMFLSDPISKYDKNMSKTFKCFLRIKRFF